MQDLPPHVARLWGERSRSGRGTLSLDAIVTKAIELADAEGLEAVAMARLAKALGFTPMSLYRHVDGKEELLALMLDEACGRPPGLAGLGWRPAIERWVWGMREVFRAHPWALHVPLSRIRMGPNRLAWMEAAFAALEDTVDGHDAAALIMVLNGLVIGSARFAEELAPADAAFGAALAQLVDAERFPAVRRAMDAGVFEADDEPDADLRYGLDRLLDGLEAELSAPGRRRPSRR